MDWGRDMGYTRYWLWILFLSKCRSLLLLIILHKNSKFSFKNVWITKIKLNVIVWNLAILFDLVAQLMSVVIVSFIISDGQWRYLSFLLQNKTKYFRLWWYDNVWLLSFSLIALWVLWSFWSHPEVILKSSLFLMTWCHPEVINKFALRQVS